MPPFILDFGLGNISGCLHYRSNVGAYLVHLFSGILFLIYRVVSFVHLFWVSSFNSWRRFMAFGTSLI